MPRSAETQESPRAQCAKHGDHDMATYYVGDMPYPYCPYCYGEWLVGMFPVRS